MNKKKIPEYVEIVIETEEKIYLLELYKFTQYSKFHILELLFVVCRILKSET